MFHGNVSLEIARGLKELRRRIEDARVPPSRLDKTLYLASWNLCGQLRMQSTKHWFPHSNPHWVVKATKDVIGDHGDIFNPRFVAFFR